MRNHIVIVDHSLLATPLATTLSFSLNLPAIISPNNIHSIPEKALVLIELWLPFQQCGLTLAHHLQKTRPDLSILIWTVEPKTFHVWAGMVLKVNGFLDKARDEKALFGQLHYALEVGMGWDEVLWKRAQTWDETIAVRLRSLKPIHWHLWSAILAGEGYLGMSQRIGRSKRAVERLTGELREFLGIERREDVILLACQWGLILNQGEQWEWTAMVKQIFIKENCDLVVEPRMGEIQLFSS